ncbi:LytR/AlgR family response regulator transcription factor [Chitinophaga japonensis]|uniref:LytTR family two component transcriptional regulator n=1 Tax=Chitinophaga japonensis TaxID=104662 RepID=A0A562SML6_CHIJA|nr:LytTR family DNA-binding domain-containing protein [Chitinophaga japonensis]TWI82413.1 LytTR family two component transcriptional regulator [Chitinophaga japonensis]
MIKTIVIEDEPAVRKEIEWLVNREKDLDLLGSAAGVHSALGLIGETAPQLALMDVQLADGTAFDILAKLKEIPFRIIFITAYNHFAVKAIKYGALDYLLKPLDEEELRAALEKVRAEGVGNLEAQQQQLDIVRAYTGQKEESLEDQLVLHTMEYIQLLQLKDIMYCRSEGSYTNFFLHDGRKVMVSRPLKYYDDLLPEKWFLRPHQSYLVNRLCIDRFMKSGAIVLKNKTEIPVSVRRRDYVLQQLVRN